MEQISVLEQGTGEEKPKKSERLVNYDVNDVLFFGTVAACGPTIGT